MSDGAPFPAELMHTGFGVLMATDTVLDALRAMDEWPREMLRAVIERHEASKRYYYLYASDELFARLQKTQTDTGWEAVPLDVALGLHDYDPVAELDASEPLPADLRGSAVVIEGDRVVGYITETDIPKVAKEHREDLKDLSSLEQQVTELYQAGKFPKAIPLAQESLELSEKAFGADHPVTARALNNLARLHSSMGDDPKAKPLVQRALKIDEMALGPDHPNTASDLNNLALLYQSLGDDTKAEPLLQRALKIKEKALGPDHPDTATALNNLARLYYSGGHNAKAQPLDQRAIKIREQTLGPDHPDTRERIPVRADRITLPALWDVASIADSFESESGGKKAKPLDKSLESPVSSSSEPRPVTRDFKAFPRLDVLKDGKQPKTVQSGDVLEVIAGFRVDIDATVSVTGPIEMRNVQQGETCLLHFFLKGLAVTDPTQFSIPEKPHQNIPLEPTATGRPFRVRVLDNATEVEVKVEYYVRGVLAGIARRKLDLTGAGTRTAKTNPCRFNLNEDEPVDLTVSITHFLDGHFEFVFSGAAVGADPARRPGKDVMTKEDSLEAARDLYDSLKLVNFRDSEARDALDGLGQRILELLPDDFFLYVNQAQALPKPTGRTVPTLLLLTDEAYIPWELTYFEDPTTLFDPAAPPYLGAQTIMGRWIPSEKIRMPPAAVCEIHKFQVFASPYTESSTRQPELLNAVKEQEQLLADYADWNPEKYEARRADLNKVKADKTQGKAVHFAVHGLSDPTANRQQLILEDNFRVPAGTLIGAYTCGDTPRFSFVFMNACQVGTPGKVFDKVSGFPGELVRGGCYGVIAPLWDVHDDVARECAMAFYKAVLRGGKSVAEALRERRATYKSDSTTPVAYVFYGHPCLKLRKGVNNG